MAGATACTASSLVGVNKTTASYYFQRLRRLIYANSEPLEMFTRGIDVDESCFGGKRKGERGRGAGGKVPVFGLLKRNDEVYTDSLNSYNALDVSEFKHLCINHSELFANGANHIDGIENFWNQAKRHLRKFNGVAKESFHFFIKECEQSFNNGNQREQLRLCKTHG